MSVLLLIVFAWIVLPLISFVTYRIGIENGYTRGYNAGYDDCEGGFSHDNKY